MGGSLNKSVTLIKSEPQGGKKPSPPVEKQINNTKGDEVHNLRALLSKKRAAMYFIPLVKLYHKDGMKHKFSILVEEDPPPPSQNLKFKFINTKITQQGGRR